MMIMMIFVVVLATVGFSTFLLDLLWRPKLNLVVPSRVPVIGHLLSFTKTPHMQLLSWAETCGGIYCIQIFNKSMVIVTDYDAAYEVLVTKGKEFAGRNRTFRTDLVSENGHGIIYQPFNPLWKKFRMVTHHSIKQVGEGLGHIENMVHETAEELIMRISKDSIEGVIDPYDSIYQAVAHNITTLITGSRLALDDPFFKNLIEMEQLVMNSVSLSRGVELDILPWIRHFGNQTFHDLSKYIAMRSDAFDTVKEKFHNGKLSKECLAYTLLQETGLASTDDCGKASDESEAHARVVIFDTILAGISTSSAAFYNFLLLMAKHPSIQANMYHEITKCLNKNGKNRISLTDRPNMPYTEACLLEMQRYSSIAPLTIDHCAMQDSDISGHKIPKGTPVFVNLFGLHHSEKYWDDPWEFHPHRFLDAEGKLVASDHINRKRLLAFGAGPRVCIGKAFAQARMFILACSLIKAFKITQAPGETIVTDPRKYKFRITLNAPNTKICITLRP